jgi:transposase-like protein
MEEIKKKCPKCGATKKQYWQGHNRSGSRKCLCGECGRRYTPEPNKHAYTEEERQQAFKLLVSGMSGRAIGLQMGMNHANVYKWAKKNERGVDKS